MSPQPLSDEPPLAVRAWTRLVRAYATTRVELRTQLHEQHGLTLNDYEALNVLSRADEQRMKRVDLAARLVLTPSGVTRLLEGLEAAGLVEKVACDTDLRISYAQLTDAGAEKLAAASCGHSGSLRTLFGDHLDKDELAALDELLGKLPGALDEDAACPTER